MGKVNVENLLPKDLKVNLRMKSFERNLLRKVQAKHIGDSSCVITLDCQWG